MAQQTTFPTRPQKKSDAGQQVWTVWSMLQYFANSVYDTFVNTVYNVFVAKFAQGQATVAATATTVTVTHNLNAAAAAYEAIAMPTIDPGGRYWISGKTATQFVINLQVAAPVGGITFDWLVKAV